MAYGIEIFSNSGGIQLDSTIPIRDFVPVAVGTGTTVGSPSLPFVPGEDLVFIRYPVDYADFVVFQMKYDFNDTTYSTMEFQTVTNPSSVLTPTGFAVTSLDYIHCKPIESAPTGNSTYGIQVLDESSVITYDSRKYTQPGAFSIIKYDNAFAYTGNPAVDSPITTDIAKYVDISDTWIVGGYDNRKMIANQTSAYGTGIYFLGSFTLFTTNYAKNFQSQIIGEKFL